MTDVNRITELEERNQILLEEVSNVRDPENVSLGEAIDVLVREVHREGYESFGVWTSMIESVAWSVTVQRFEDGALTPNTQIARLAERIQRLEDAIETLVVDEIISSGKARELKAQSVEEQRARWRDFFAKTGPNPCESPSNDL